MTIYLPSTGQSDELSELIRTIIEQGFQLAVPHDDIEVYNSKGQHLGSMDPITGEMYKDAVDGRTIEVG